MSYLRKTLAVNHRVFLQIFRDRRSRVFLLITPSLVLCFGRYLFSSGAAFSRTGTLMLGVLPAFAMCLLGSIAIVHERAEGTLEAVLTTPATKGNLVGGYMLAALLLSLGQAVLTTTVAYTIGGLTTASPPWLLGLLAALSGVFGMSLGLCVSAISRNEGEAAQFIPGVLVPQLLVSGLFWPISEMGGWTRRLEGFLPLSTLTRTLTYARLYRFGGVHFLYSLAATLAVIAAAFVCAVRTISIRTSND